MPENYSQTPKHCDNCVMCGRVSEGPVFVPMQVWRKVRSNCALEDFFFFWYFQRHGQLETSVFTIVSVNTVNASWSMEVIPLIPFKLSAEGGTLPTWLKSMQENEQWKYVYQELQSLHLRMRLGWSQICPVKWAPGNSFTILFMSACGQNKWLCCSWGMGWFKKYIQKDNKNNHSKTSFQQRFRGFDASCCNIYEIWEHATNICLKPRISHGIQCCTACATIQTDFQQA